MLNNEFEVFDLGLIDFFQARQFQKEVFKAVKNHYLPSALIICRHYPVITLGRLANKNNILVSYPELIRRGIAVYEIERGGDVTYHGPGQITVYPIMDLQYFKKDISWFLRQLEQVIIDLLSDYGISGLRQPGCTGVWIETDKIASVGIAVKNWITFHGLSLDVKKDDLANFGLIRPCGLDVHMTSLESVLDRSVNIEEIKVSLINKFSNIFEVTVPSLSGFPATIPLR